MAQLLAAPVLFEPLEEEPLEPLEEEPLEPLGAVDALVVAESVLGLSAPFLSALLLSLDPESLEPSAGFFAPLLLYRSAYQPPPLRMNPAPPDT
ncbi:MAG TPA: hypothetical protein VJN18_16560 [Polyangiaceae bacterium]|nr:hypothetical protein [Polyangiaceae bacterium]